jgi:hypothetical protein
MKDMIRYALILFSLLFSTFCSAQQPEPCYCNIYLTTFTSGDIFESEGYDRTVNVRTSDMSEMDMRAIMGEDLRTRTYLGTEITSWYECWMGVRPISFKTRALAESLGLEESQIVNRQELRWFGGLVLEERHIKRVDEAFQLNRDSTRIMIDQFSETLKVILEDKE